ncbi:phage tail protein [Aeromonas caviae]|uniref:phage tail-collar fiber domain-containing protein n=1 Tax=Aeromonas caviae TaxID=648 RepID=UPI0029DD6006|nr:phage tail protein [Aeromonas caviae]MDX7752440.1 phage tail protein [Aeromonas caviae]MDX7775449.1 phage tail protein [Aeromonas caviae]
MSAIYFAILTDAGQAKMANALALGVPLKITHMAVGDGNGQPVTPNAAQTALVREKRRSPINTLFQDPTNQSQLVAEQIIPEDVGDWWIREIGVFSEDGTMIAVANTPDTYKPLLSSGAGRTQVIRIVLIVSDTSAVELKIDPAVVLATRKYVDDLMAAHKEGRDHPEGTQTNKGMLRLATQGEAIAGLLGSVAVAPKEMKDAMEALLDIVAPVGVPIPWGAATPPNSRFLLAQGQSFDKAAYPKLATLWPTGVIPFDLRGEFIRGWDNGRGVDAGRGVLSTQSWQTAAIRGAEGAPDVGNVSYMSSNQGPVANRIHPITRDTFGAVTVNMNNTAGAETRPRNIAFNYIVRAA